MCNVHALPVKQRVTPGGCTLMSLWSTTALYNGFDESFLTFTRHCSSLSISKRGTFPSVSFPLENKNSRQTTKADLAGQQVHHTPLFTPGTFLICCIFRGCFEGRGGRALGRVGTLSFLSWSANSWDFCPQSQWSAIVWFGSHASPHQSSLSISCSVTAVRETLRCSAR